MDKKSTAVRYKRNGCNCCQAVIMAYRDELGLSESDVMRTAAAFAAGMGCMQANCGALIGAGIVLGIKEYGKSPVPPKARKLITRFTEMCGSDTCIELKGVLTGKVLCSCDDCVANAVEALEETLK